jgi:Gluconate 2-dehydrogenase subunit 3
MERRELLKMIALATGGVVIGGELFLTGCKSGATTEAGFTASNIALLDEIGETILPATSSPGAKAAQVGEFMKVYVTDCYTQKQQAAFNKGLSDINEAAKKLLDKSFMEATPEERTKLLLSLEKEAKAENEKMKEEDKVRKDKAKAEGKESEFEATPPHYYTMMKQLTLMGFFTSKVGSTEALRHVAVPGKFDPCLPYKKGDRAWA